MRSLILGLAACFAVVGISSAEEVKPYVARPLEPVTDARPAQPTVKPGGVKPVERYDATPVKPYYAKPLDGTMPAGRSHSDPASGGVRPVDGSGNAVPRATGDGAHSGAGKRLQPVPAQADGMLCGGVQIQGNTTIAAAGSGVDTQAMGSGNDAETAIGAIDCAQIQGSTTINATGANVTTTAAGTANRAKSAIGTIGK